MTQSKLARHWLLVLTALAVLLPLAACRPSPDRKSRRKAPANVTTPTVPDTPDAIPGEPDETQPAESPDEAIEKPQPDPAPLTPETDEKKSPEPSDPSPEMGEPETPDKPETPDMPAAEEGEQEGGDFSLKELEENRKRIREEMAKEEIRRAKEQKRRIALLGAPLVEGMDKLVRLHEVYPVWTDPAKKRVIMVGEIAQRQVPLELFACTRSTKEHEAIVVVDAEAQIVHAGLLAVGAKPGKPVQFHPEYSPAAGQEIEVTVLWKDEQGKVQSARAQDWIRNAGTKKAMEYHWVFAGSMFAVDEYSGKTYYQADGGDFICVSNFATAMLDLPVESSSVNQNLAFEAFTERIPERGTAVTVILTPKAGDQPAAKETEKPAAEAGDKAEAKKSDKPAAEEGEKPAAEKKAAPSQPKLTDQPKPEAQDPQPAKKAEEKPKK